METSEFEAPSNPTKVTDHHIPTYKKKHIPSNVVIWKSFHVTCSLRLGIHITATFYYILMSICHGRLPIFGQHDFFALNLKVHFLKLCKNTTSSHTIDPPRLAHRRAKAQSTAQSWLATRLRIGGWDSFMKKQAPKQTWKSLTNLSNGWFLFVTFHNDRHKWMICKLLYGSHLPKWVSYFLALKGFTNSTSNIVQYSHSWFTSHHHIIKLGKSPGLQAKQIKSNIQKINHPWSTFVGHICENVVCFPQPYTLHPMSLLYIWHLFRSKTKPS